MKRRSSAKTLLLNWFDKGKPTAQQRKFFAADIDRFFDALAERNDWCECISILLDDKGGAKFSMGGRGWRARPSEQGLVVTSIVPAWNFGWRSVLKDELSEHILSTFGHLARQYIHRSNVAKVLMAVWEDCGLVLHPFGNGYSSQRYSDFCPRPSSDQEIFARAEQVFSEQWGLIDRKSRVCRSKWMSRNSLDPAIHQGIFHFLRGQNLVNAGFELEALAAYDCVLHSVQYLDWSWASGNPKRDRRDLLRALGFGEASASLAEEVYFLRNQFVAHAGGWRWWDTVDYLEDDLAEKSGRLASRVLRKAADIEPRHRTLEPQPDDWASWIEANFAQIWSAVWSRDP